MSRPNRLSRWLRRLSHFSAILKKGRRLIEEARKRLELFTVERYVETLENYYDELWERAMRR
ncbi:MAG: hypothetical protein NT106_11860 [Candidatus Sumerlaeota bacterium]|nr:hypothetical protein [Candidatus Sumerlaeota bacterium]